MLNKFQKRILIAAVAAVLAVLMASNGFAVVPVGSTGILLTFGLKSPKWRPGLILLIIWAIALVVLIPLLAVDIASIVSARP